MKIFVDADACPGPVRDLILAMASRHKFPTVFVANKPLSMMTNDLITTALVPAGPDVADAWIAERAVAGDLVISQDIPLAGQLVPNGVCVISPYGTVFTPDNIGERLSMRNMLTDFRDAGAITGGPKPFDATTKRQFANALDREVTRLLKQAGSR